MTLGATYTDPMVDEHLVAAFVAGDEGAFAALYARYDARITGYALRMLGRREDAEEVCTEAFVRLVERRWRPVGRVRSFLFTVAHRLCLDHLRRRNRRARLMSMFGAAPAPVPTAEELLGGSERDRALAKAIEGLPEGHRAVVLLTYAEGLTSPEVAEIVGATEQQVRSKLAYARRLLRDVLEVSVEPGT